MKQSRFTEEQIIQILVEAKAGMKIEELCRKYGISSATYYSWKAKFGGMSIPDAKRLRALEAENSKLKRLVGELSLDIIALKDVVSRKW
jgi:putative transposase